MAAQVVGYEYKYDVPTQTTDSGGNPITVDMPMSFMLGSISEDVAKGIRYGLRQVPSIKNVTAVRVLEDRDALAAGNP